MRDPAHQALAEARARTLGLVAHLEPEELEKVFIPILSPLAWDLGHIAAYEDLWVNHRLSGRPLLHQELAALYDAFETPRASRGEARFLRGDELWKYLDEVRSRSLEAPLTDRALHELVVRHELQHTETMLQALSAGSRLPPGWDRTDSGVEPLGGGDFDLLEMAQGTFVIGAPEPGFSYDNERPRHAVDLPGYAIARRPVSNAAWVAFIEDGGYVQRELWSDAGWLWRAAAAVEDHAGARSGHPDAAVVHISGHEADAFARAHGLRLPSEPEWEAAAAAGRLEGVGEVWEWTRSEFHGYPGFQADPYREYSQVFFGQGYRALRGWSRATAERVASIHFRNWDLPERRQLFAGLRLAADAS